MKVTITFVLLITVQVMLRVDVAYSEPGKPLQTVQNLAAQTPDLLQFTGGKRIRDAFKGLVSGNYLKLGKGRISGKEPLAALGLAVVGSKLGIVKSNKSPKYVDEHRKIYSPGDEVEVYGEKYRVISEVKQSDETMQLMVVMEIDEPSRDEGASRALLVQNIVEHDNKVKQLKAQWHRETELKMSEVGLNPMISYTINRNPVNEKHTQILAIYTYPIVETLAEMDPSATAYIEVLESMIRSHFGIILADGARLQEKLEHYGMVKLGDELRPLRFMYVVDASILIKKGSWKKPLRTMVAVLKKFDLAGSEDANHAAMLGFIKNMAGGKEKMTQDLLHNIQCQMTTEYGKIAGVPIPECYLIEI